MTRRNINLSNLVKTLVKLKHNLFGYQKLVFVFSLCFIISHPTQQSKTRPTKISLTILQQTYDHLEVYPKKSDTRSDFLRIQ